MENVPQEIVDNILYHLLVRRSSLTERHALITKESKKDISNARLVCHNFFESRSLQDAFVQVLEETMLLFEDPHSRHLIGVATSKNASKMTILTISTYNTAINSPISKSVIGICIDSFQKFRNVNTIRFTAPALKQCGTSRFKERFYVVCAVLDVFSSRRIFFQDIEMSTRTLMPDTLCTGSVSVIASAGQRQAEFVRHFSVSEIQEKSRPVVSADIEKFKHLEVFELSLWNAERQHGSHRCRAHHVLDHSVYMKPMPNLKVFRLSSTFTARFRFTEILMAMKLFPNLERVGLAYVVLTSRTEDKKAEWTSLIQGLRVLRIKSIQLLFPAYHEPDERDSPYAPQDFGGDYEAADTGLGYRVQIRRYANGLDVIPFEDEASWRNHPLIGEGGTDPLGFHVFDM